MLVVFVIMIGFLARGYGTAHGRDFPWLGVTMVTLLGTFLGAGLISLPALVLCRCQACGSHIFDPNAGARKGLYQGLREDWRIIRGRGRCPSCDAPLE